MCVGGIRRSTIATSGVTSPTGATSSSAVAGLADDVEARPRRAAARRPRAAASCRRPGLRAWDLRSQPGPAGRRAPDPQPPVERLDAVGQPAQAGAARRDRRRPCRRRRPRPPACRSRARRRRSRSWPRRTWRRSSGPRRRGSRRRPRPAPAGARRASTCSATRTGARAASDSSATGSPWSLRTAGWMPRAIPRSSSSDAVSSSRAVWQQLRLRRVRRQLAGDQRAARSRARRAAAGRRRGGRARACGGRCRRPRRSARARPAGRSAGRAGRPAGARSRARSRRRR